MDVQKQIQGIHVQSIENDFREITETYLSIIGSIREPKIHKNVLFTFELVEDEKRDFAFKFLGEKYLLSMNAIFHPANQLPEVITSGVVAVWKENDVTAQNEEVCRFELLRDGSIPEMGIKSKYQNGRDSTFLKGLLVGIIATNTLKTPAPAQVI